MLIHCAGTIRWQAIAVSVGSLAVILLWPKVTRRVPGSVVALLVATCAHGCAAFFRLRPSGAGLAAFRKGFRIFRRCRASGLPSTYLPLLPSAVEAVALLAAVESLLSAVVADGMSGDRHNSGNMELVAQGVANIASPVFGGIPATGAIARTATNIRSGALDAGSRHSPFSDAAADSAGCGALLRTVCASGGAGSSAVRGVVQHERVA